MIILEDGVCGAVKLYSVIPRGGSIIVSKYIFSLHLNPIRLNYGDTVAEYMSKCQTILSHSSLYVSLCNAIFCPF